MGTTPDYVGELLPGQVMTGIGVGLSFAAWGSAAVWGTGGTIEGDALTVAMNGEN